ncbi:uncharacterized protein LOC124659172 isoform X5 [Lolium rigidum]|uniref:uncharacterized protein LOC124659172 isoform X5 n=1 Tax=Lolium rigidum TaxID=89674 RepID=UPI001F5D500E|nr:uncharacterized protein LOC124659172 isoform X5 [Lolium rigidum]
MMMMKRTRAVQSGHKLRLFVPPEYPCVRRLRHRRLLAFLWLQGYGSTFVAMLNHTNSYFCVFHLVHLVSQGQWTKALDYIFPRFLPLEPPCTPSLQASVLVKFLRVHHLFHELACCKFSRDWRAMWAKAAKIVGDLANRTPEFKDRLLLPDGLMGPQNVLPIGFGFAPFRRRRHINKCTRPTTKHARQEHNRRIAYIYLHKRKSMPSSSHCSQELPPEIFAKARDDWFQTIFEECIKAATHLELNQGCVLQSSAREGASVTGNSQPQIGKCPQPQTQSPVPNWRPSKMMTRTRAVVCGQELQLSVPGEYPCVRRFRYRRLLTFLRLQGYGSTFVAMLKQTNYYFCVFHLARLVSQGLWNEALDYIFPRFLPLEPSSPPSLEASVLVKFLRVHRLFQLEVARISKISQDWRPMWARAAKIVRDLANRTPEFKDRLLLPDGLMGPQNILPIGFSFAPFRQRRHAKKCTHPTSKHAREEHTRRLANIYFDKRMSLPSSTHCSQELSPESIAKARDDWFRRIFEQCIKAATCLEINQGSALQSSPWEGTPVTGNVINPRFSSVPLTTDADTFGNVIDSKKSFISSVNGSAISQTMLNSEVTSTTNAGTCEEICFSERACQGSHLRKRSMTEQVEDYLATKKRLTTGANGEASTDKEVCFTRSVCQGSHSRKRPRAEMTEDYSATKRQLISGNNGQW